ncbi:hypothetical protein DL240_11230 [Lujinxingia litoralis]|uniref:histidine kinase n=1 Tax=Lujinxingia litoralis TaxID=2211119 RepID=A0A328C6H8_9DELT|nr:response regulator [Lujinxingia litoralis]RAL22412.1 hypothetical protein DL240_11230 [Lujinxingia litoralis]
MKFFNFEDSESAGEQPRRRGTGRWLVVLVLVVGVAASLGGWWWLRQREADHVRGQFQRDAQLYASSVERRLLEKRLNMLAMLAFYRGSDVVEADEFRTFVETYLEGRSQIALLAWVPYVSESARSAFEASASRELGEDYEIVEPGQNVELMAARPRPDYAPTLHVWQAKISAKPGFNWLAIPRVANALRQARETGEVVMTGPIDLPGSSESSVLYGFVAAVSREEGTPEEHFAGWLIGVLHMQEVIAEAMQVRPAIDIEFELVDESDPGEPRTVYAWSGAGEEASTPEGQSDAESEVWRGRSAAEQGLVFHRPLNLPGPSWALVARPTEAYVSERVDRSTTVFLISGLLVTLIGVLYVNTTVGRTRRVERLVDERTASLREHREKLRTIAIEMARARQEAVEATRAKSSFLANMSHEIRTPMNGVIGMAELLQETQLNGKQHEYLTLLDRSARGLLALLNDILDFSKIEAGQLELDHREFRPIDTVAETLQVLATRASQKGLELVYSIEADFPFAVIGDPDRLRQVLINLVGNAIKFTDTGQVEIEMGFELQGDEEVEITMVVRDTGVGIPKKEQARIFEAFRQVDSSSRRQHEGTGLGLSISAQLVDLMGGHIELESEEGEGTEVTFTVLLELSQRWREEQEHQLASRRALVVDDNPVNRRLLRVVLTIWKMEVEVAADVASAREILAGQEEPFDVVLIDAIMPGEPGLELAREVFEQRDSQKQKLPAVMLMSSVGAVSSSEFDAFSTDYGERLCVWLSKPVKPSDLYDALSDCVVEGHRATESGALLEGSGEEEGICVLLVEDSPVNQKVARGLLARGEHRVELARDGQEAVEIFGADPQRFDLVLMDIQMPRMDGFEATRAIRELEREGPRERPLPIVALTAHAMKGDRERMLRAGMDDYLAKPIQPEELMRVISKWRPVEEGESPPSGESPGEAREEGAAPEPRGEGAAKEATPESDETPPKGGSEPEEDTMDTPSNGIWDPEIAHTSTGDDETLLRELASVFVEESSHWLRDLQAAIAHKDAREVRRLAHTIKGSALIFGARPVSQLAEQLEMMGKDAALEQAPPRYERLVKATGRLVEVLEDELLETSSESEAARGTGAGGSAPPSSPPA